MIPFESVRSLDRAVDYAWRARVNEEEMEEEEEGVVFCRLKVQIPGHDNRLAARVKIEAQT
jgi:hypothetical protein